jgi:hypothetical protein
MDELKAVIAVFSAVTPLGLAGGLVYVIYLLVKQRREGTAAHAELTTNHLHELPDMAQTLRRIERQNASSAAAVLGQLSDIRESLAYLKARVNGKS